jgi:DNA mismatch endonuclease, patch repair protein
MEGARAFDADVRHFCLMEPFDVLRTRLAPRPPAPWIPKEAAECCAVRGQVEFEERVAETLEAQELAQEMAQRAHRPSVSAADTPDGARFASSHSRAESTIVDIQRSSVHVPRPETSRRMKSVRQAGTLAELAVRRALSSFGFRYRVNVKSLPGSPDVANVKRGFAVFAHGCFWHRHPGCRYATTPKTNRAFWIDKLKANVCRDLRAKKDLERRGFRVIVVWECEARTQRVEKKLLDALRGIPRR